MSRRTVVLLVALLLAAASAFAVWRYLNTVEQNVRADIQEVVVYRATELIPEQTTGEAAQNLIEPGRALVETVVFEGSRIVCGGPADPDAPDVDFTVCDDNPRDLGAVLGGGAVSAGPISAGQLITTDMFLPPAELALDSVSRDIPVGKTAIAISPGEVGAVGGLVKPGDRVNILATFNLDVSTVNELLADPATRGFVLDSPALAGVIAAGAQTPTTVPGAEQVTTTTSADPITRYAQALPENVEFTQTILQNIEVIAIGEETRTSPITDTPREPDAPVVLEVSYDEAELVEFARQQAVLSLALLPAGEAYPGFEARGATVDDIFTFVTRIQDQLEEIVGR